MAKSASAEDYRLRGSIESLRAALADDRFADRRERPLAYWALPVDRRLPLALLGCTLRDLLAMPYERLAGTPGIGQKKLRTLVTLLERAVEQRRFDELPPRPTGVETSDGSHDRSTDGANQTGAVLPLETPLVLSALDERFDPAAVSESVWAEWTETVRRHGLGGEKIGRLAPALLDVPTVIWNTPLSTYFGHGVAEIRQWRTYGEKRVRVVLEVFSIAHRMLARSDYHSQLAVRILPKFIPPIEDWISETLVRPGVPDHHEVRQGLAMPLLNQLAIDVGAQVQQLAEDRLGIESPPQSVLTQARKLGVTRARVYQLLESCVKVMDVRWPEGRVSLGLLADKFSRQAIEPRNLRLFQAVRDLFFPLQGAAVEPTPRDRHEAEAG